VSMQKTLAQYVVVGLVDTQWTAVQCGTRLLLLDHARLAEILLYQLVLRRFCALPAVPLARPISIKKCIRAALDLPEAQWERTDGSRDEIAERAAALLAQKATMLREYFSLSFAAPAEDATGCDADGSVDAALDSRALLATIPEILPGHRPAPQHLGMFLLRLATDTDWEQEQECFQGVAARLADFFSRLCAAGAEAVSPAAEGVEEREGGPADGPGEQRKDADKDDQTRASSPRIPAPVELQRLVVEVLLPAMRAHLVLPSDCATDGTVVQVAALEQLYKVFERC